MTKNRSLFGTGRRLARVAGSLAVALAMLATLSLAPADAQCRGGSRARRVYSQPYPNNAGYYPQQNAYYGNYPGYPQNVYYGNYPGYSDPYSYNPYDQGPG